MAAYASETDIKNELKPRWVEVCTQLKPIWYHFRGATRDKQIDAESAAAWQIYSNAKASTLDELLLGDLKLRSHVEIMKNFGTTSGSTTTMERGTLFNDADAAINKDQVIETAKEITRLNLIKSGTIADTQATLPPQYIAGLDSHIRNGSVLNDGFWWPLINDAWLIGGVHSLKRFHLALADVNSDLLWNSARRPKGPRLRMLGRELIGLYEAGYRLVGLPAWTLKRKQTAQDGTETTVETAVASKDVRAAMGYVFAPTDKAKALALSFTSYRTAVTTFTGLKAIRDAMLDESKALPFDTYDFSKL